MKKKIAAFAMAAMLTMTTAMGVSASNDEFTYTEPHPVIFGVQNTRATSNFGACTISSGSTMGFSSGNNGWTFSKGSSVTFTFYTKEKQASLVDIIRVPNTQMYGTPYLLPGADMFTLAKLLSLLTVNTSSL